MSLFLKQMRFGMKTSTNIQMPDTVHHKITCIGAGYVGGPTMAVFASKCPNVQFTVVDISKPRIDAWNSKSLPIYEPGLDALVEKCRGVNLFFSTNVEMAVMDADIIFVSVNTPTKTTGLGAGKAPDMKYIDSCARTIARVCKSNKIIVEKSTVPCKTAEYLKQILEASSEYRFDVLSNPEFLAEGTGIRDLEFPDRVIIGSMQDTYGIRAMHVLRSLYERWVPSEKIITTNVWSSELSKLAANALLAQRISSVNALSAICERTGADISEVSYACGLDKRIGPNFLRASVGFGGSCFTKDILNLCYLSESLGLPEVAEYWMKVLEINSFQKARFTSKIITDMFSSVNGKVLTIFGFAFKKNTGDTRMSPAIDICKQLLEEGAILKIHDPKVLHSQILSDLGGEMSGFGNQVTCFGNSFEATYDSHAIILLTEWPCYSDFDYNAAFLRMQKPAFIYDGRGILDHKRLRGIGYKVFCIGKAN